MGLFFLPCVLDDDSEPILGQWFEETISPSKEKVAPPPPPPPPPLESSPRVKSPNKQSAGENGNILASRKDPELVRPELGPGELWGLGAGTAGLWHRAPARDSCAGSLRGKWQVVLVHCSGGIRECPGCGEGCFLSSPVRWNVSGFVAAREAEAGDCICLGCRGRGRMGAELQVK